MNFADSLRNESAKTFTENGMPAYKTTFNACLDLFGVIGALRHNKSIDFERAETLFVEAMKEDPLVAIKIVFYARDVRGGLGERDIPRHLFNYIANRHFELLVNNIKLIPEFGRYDDWYCLVDTPLESDMWIYMGRQFKQDLVNMNCNRPVSLLAKWIKSPDASSKTTRQLGIRTAYNLGYTVYAFKRELKALRAYLRIVERDMSANRWNKIDYPAVPSRAMMNYRNAFERHDTERFSAFIDQALNGKVKINSSTLYPYDIVEKFLYGYEKDARTLSAQWNQLPNYVEPGQNVLIMADVSGSMVGRPMASSIGLAMYFAERNVGAFHNLFMTFSGNPEIVTLRGENFKQKIKFIENVDWGMNTDIDKALVKILNVAVKNNVPKEEMPKALVIISDMEFDDCTFGTDFMGNTKRRFEQAGYDLPQIVFWNVDSRNEVYHASADCNKVTLVSGHSVSTFKNLLSSINKTPVEFMLETINSERYKDITI